MNLPQEQETPENPAPSRNDRAFVSGQDFYTERIVLPVGVSGRELEEALLNQIEASSPFSRDHLAWGAVVDREQGHAFLYASFSEVLPGDEHAEEAPESDSSFPSFLPFLNHRLEEPGLVCSVNGETVSLLVFDQPGQLPAEVHSVDLPGVELADETVVKVCADLLRDLPRIGLKLQDRILRFEKIEKNWKHETLLSWRSGDEEPVRFSLSSWQAYLADVRPAEIKTSTLMQNRLNLWLWGLSLGSLGLLLLLMIATAATTFLKMRVQELTEQVENQQEKVAQIESKARNLEVFESGSGGRLQPLSMLDILNRERPDGLFFSEVKAFEGNRIQIEGVAESNGTARVNEFRDAVENLDLVEQSTMEITRISQGSTFFRLSVVFTNLELKEVGEHD